MRKTGKECYNERWDGMCKRKINTCDSSWSLPGFYNYLVIKRSYRTAYCYLGYVVDFMNTVVSIDNINVDSYYSYMAALKTASSASQIGAYHALQKYSTYLNSKGMTEDYMKYIDRPKFIESQSTIDKREIGYLTKSETKKIINSTKYKNKMISARNNAIFMIFLTTGIRCSALYKLDVDNVDLVNKTITVYEKGDKNRIANIPDQTVNAITEWLKYRSELLKDNPKENALIVSNRKKRMDSQSIYNIIKGMGRCVTGKNITPHKLRATYGTQLYNKTHDIFFVQECMGHSNPKTTEMYIRGNKSEFSKKAADLMGGFIE